LTPAAALIMSDRDGGETTAAPKRQPRRSALRVPSAEGVVAGAVLLIAFVLYARTAAPTITWQNGGADSGELVTASYTLGIAHPPGYPLYVLLGKGWSLLPLGEIAHRYSLFSALCGALATALVGVLTIHLWRRLHPLPGDPVPRPAAPPVDSLLVGTAAGLALAAAPAFWAQATVPEVYTLNALLLVAALGLLLRWSARQADAAGVGLVALASLIVGLGLGNHRTIVFLVPCGLVYVLSYGWRRIPLRGWLLVALAFLAGLAVYGYLPVRAAQGPLVNWGDPSTPERFLHHVTAADYRGYLFGRPVTDVLLRVPVIARLILEQFTWVGVLLVLLGIGEAWTRLRREAVLLLGIGLVNGAFALLYNAEGSQVYLLPTYVVAAILLGLGIGSVWRLAARDVPPRWRRATAAALVVLTLLLPASRVASAYSSVDVSTDYQALEYALTTLRAAPPGEPIYPSTDEETFPLWYAQDVLHVRPDVPVVNPRLWHLGWYREHLARRYPGVLLSGESNDPR
jgi:hypothetical protein